jgi:hypothetical protein
MSNYHSNKETKIYHFAHTDFDEMGDFEATHGELEL